MHSRPAPGLNIDCELTRFDQPINASETVMPSTQADTAKVFSFWLERQPFFLDNVRRRCAPRHRAASRDQLGKNK
jgi:hypothetical protein